MADAAKSPQGICIRVALSAALFALCTAAAPEPEPRPAPAPQRRALVAPAEIDNTLAIGGKDIAARRVSTRMTVAVQLDGRGPYRFVVDSGADTSVVSARVAGALNLRPGTSAMLHGMTSSEPVKRVRVAELGLGDSVAHDLQLPVLQEDDIGGEGMIGIDALVSQRLMMDFEKRVITIEDARRPPPERMAGEVVVTARRRRGQLILTQASVDGHALEAVIDTGSEVTIGNSALRALLARRYARRIESVTMIGVTGVEVKIDLIRIAELRVGSVVLRDVPVAFADVPPFRQFALDKGPGLLLGTDMMATFRRVSLDFKARKVRFQLRRCGDNAGIRLDTTTTPSRGRLSWADPGGSGCI